MSDYVNDFDKERPYRVIILGETGVGKSLFLGSYFYAARHCPEKVGKDWKGDILYHIGPALGLTEKAIMELQEDLFSVDRAGTQRKVNISFRVDELNMDITLFDLPGGYVRDAEQMAKNGLSNDLAWADGIVIFISAFDAFYIGPERARLEQVVAHYAQTLENLVGLGKKDTPVYIVYTQGDRLRGATPNQHELTFNMGNVGMRLETAAQKLGGEFHRSFLTQATGLWKGNTPPPIEEYDPVNVVETMESLFEDMLQARCKRLKCRPQDIAWKWAKRAMVGGGGVWLLSKVPNPFGGLKKFFSNGSEDL